MKVKKAGVKRRPKQVTPNIPNNTAVPSDCRISAPAPVATASGATPKMKAREVIRIGRRRVRAACTAASLEATPSSSFWRANSTIRMAFLAARPTRTTKPICARMSMGMARASRPVIEASRHIGTIRTIASGSFQLSYCATRTRKTKRAAVPKTRRVGVLESEVGPLKSNALGKNLVGKLLHAIQCRASGDTRRRYPLHLGGRKKIVARHAVWDRFAPELRHCPNRHHFTGCVAGLQAGNVLRGTPEFSISLDADLIGAAKIVEVVHVL